VTAEVVNLRRARKAKARAEAETQAAANRAAFGRTKSEKTLRDAQDALALRRHEGHRRDAGAQEADAQEAHVQEAHAPNAAKGDGDA